MTLTDRGANTDLPNLKIQIGVALQRNQIIGIAVAAVVGMAVYSGLKYFVGSGGGVEQELDRLEAEDPMVMAIATNFPAEWPGLRALIVADAKSGMSVQEVTERAFVRSRAFMQERAPATAAASTPSLVSTVKGEAAFIAQLQQDNVQDCADFAMRGLKPTARLSATALARLAPAVQARVKATREGLDNPIERPSAREADWAAVMAGMQANGLSEAGVEAFQNPDSASLDDQCEGGVHLYRAVSELPPEQAARVYAEMTREAAQTGAP